MAKLTKVEDNKTNLQWKNFKHIDADDCPHCKFTIAENSIPTNEFEFKDKLGNPVIVTEIKIIRGKYGDCIGWVF